MKKVVFKIVDMHCSSCSITIDGDLEDTEGVTRAQTSYAKALTEVEFDSQKIDEQTIIKIVRKTGYSIIPL